MTPTNFDWQRNFNHLETVLWIGVAVYLATCVKSRNRHQRWVLWIAAATFVIFGASDWLEAGLESRVPLWLYAMKIACGASIFACRFTWLGWRKWHWRHREFLFGVFCLIAVSLAIWFQYGDERWPL